MSALETHHLRLAMLPLSDSAPLVVAADQGFFAEEGLDVELRVESSWAAVRDAIQLEQVEAAHLLPLMPLAATLGLDGRPTPMLSALTLNLNGNAISLSRPLFEHMCRLLPEAAAHPQRRAEALARVIAARREAGLEPLRLASVHPFSSHRYLLRAWLDAAGIDPDRDVELRVVPPPLMADQVEAGWIDGYCVGAPWNDLGVERGVAVVACEGYAIWHNAGEKVLGVREQWAERHPNTHHALLRALIRAGHWLDADAEHRLAACRMLIDGGYLALPHSVVEAELHARFVAGEGRDAQRDIHFARFNAQHPWRTHTLWFAAQLHRWGHFDDEIRLREAVERCVRPDIYRAAAHSLGIATARAELCSLGEHAEPHHIDADDGTVLLLGADSLLAGGRFDPSAPFPASRVQKP
ncbi:CmpA/NrtA family ABC transporter substrate-binding protein [Halotalea alkalilenta]|uniref:Nitrate transporter n=1 Tax=Halotalea alkalilenta TaxID=376489 RepID=A0A172YHH9_9GAMM|nr:CmpA/NrtA family ABC transporter substrate-binding protein [Halotalea alkalilenta]ANF58562.1 hypothetical protein A5892_14670 [Halotalea alkalilenta]